MRSLTYRILEVLHAYNQPMPYNELEMTYTILYGRNYSSRHSIHMGLWETLTKMIKNKLVDFTGQRFRTYFLTSKGKREYSKLKDKQECEIVGVIK